MRTVVVTLTDKNYFNKAKRTIADVRSRGEWRGDIVLLTVEFDAPRNFVDYYRVMHMRVDHVDTHKLVEAYKKNPIRPTCDDREYKKLTQWDKFHVFNSVFQNWDRVIYLDAGLRVFDKIEYLADIPCKGKFMAPDDAAPYDNDKRFGGIIETDQNEEVVHKLFQEFDPSILKERYFLNCIWMYDTVILRSAPFHELIRMMNDYPICRCNEMTIMNLLFTFKRGIWQPFPEWIDTPRKRLFGWTEHDHDYGSHTTWRDFCFIKYPSTINFDCE